MSQLRLLRRAMQFFGFLAAGALCWNATLPAQDKAADWPLVRGNALQTGVAEAKLPDKLEILWEFKADDAFEDAACIVAGAVYAASYDEHLYAVDLATGKQKWKYKAGPTKAAP